MTVTTKFRLLVVDDQQGVRRLLYEAFYDDEFEVLLAQSGFEAIDLVKSFAPDLILL
jgi:two-component system response regulator (stage 0 sporulation protein F)